MKYVAALTRHDHAATVINGYRPPILPEDIGTVHAVHDELRAPLERPIRSSDALYNATHTSDFETLWETKKPVFHEESTAGYRSSVCGIYVKVLLPMNFSAEDPDACHHCIARMARIARREQLKREA